MAKDYVQHDGIVTGISSHTVEVSIQSHSACAGCHAKSACGIADMKQKVITAKRPESEIRIGEQVVVYASTSNAAFSVIIAYVIPSVLILAAIFWLEKSGISELEAAVGSLVLLVIYFIVLYFFRNKISKKIKFTVQPKGNY